MLAKAGIPLDRLADQLGHGEIKQTMICARYHPDYGAVEPYLKKASASLGFPEAATSEATAPHATEREEA